MDPILNGIVLIDKPPGISSFGVVAKVRGIWRQRLHEAGLSIKKAKVGHTGTLDPFASGLLILVLGSATKQAAHYSKLDKTYQATVKLGIISSTGDPEGELTHSGAAIPDQVAVEDALQGFIGEQQQMPPAFSAIKVNGQRAYALARKGQEVTLTVRTVTIYAIDDISYSYPDLSFTVRVSSGTYIRSLAQDIGTTLGCGAYLHELRRTSVGEHSVVDALSLDMLDYDTLLRHSKLPLSNNA